ncbi:globin-coupled sensor protein [Halobacterium litoreum]|uniref:Globin-coupled sensor protein n=1 Tax=Halobacterium litoreum TaxID=2039234 RepID=A0ABD5NCY8_9EURY|nr:globin-coupled sensor protein [Halobacterium litoreum]UHH14192.1 globin-coupled sensor protein [Halobacterium litoreum]
MAADDAPQVDEEVRRGVDGNRLADRIGLDAEEIAWRKEFTGLDAGDADALADESALFDSVADDLVADFYDHLQGHERTLDIFGRSTKTVDQLKRTQTEYLRDLGRGEYDREYVEQRARIGKIHDVLDLGPEVYLGAYTKYYEGLLDAVAEDVTEDRGAEAEAAVSELAERFLPMLKLLTFDQQVAMDTYIDSYAQRLQAEVDRRQELAGAVAEDVEEPLSSLVETSEDVAAQTDEMQSLTDAQVDRMSDVAREISSVSASVEEVAATADDVRETSEDAEEMARRGESAADDALEVMDDIDDATDGVTDDVERLQERAADVEDVTGVIDDIAEQTNLLALNASIEAARAGEAGDGFAVVAEEVKALAEESREQSTRVEEMVERMQADTEETVEQLDEMNARIAEGVERVEEAMETLRDITDAVEAAATGVQEVSAATDEQATSTEEVAEMVDDVDRRTGEIADALDDVAEATERQRRTVEEVRENVERLT